MGQTPLTTVVPSELLNIKEENTVAAPFAKHPPLTPSCDLTPTPAVTSQDPTRFPLASGFLLDSLRNKHKEMGVEANRAGPNPIAADPEHVEALLEAARYNDFDDVKSLDALGVPLDSKDEEGRTALHMASANGNVDIVNYLISNKADVNASNVENNTPLHWACLNGHIEVVKILILAGANVSSLNRHERTPVDEAAIGGKMDVIDAINTAAAQVELTNASV